MWIFTDAKFIHVDFAGAEKKFIYCGFVILEHKNTKMAQGLT